MPRIFRTAYKIVMPSVFTVAFILISSVVQAVSAVDISESSNVGWKAASKEGLRRLDHKDYVGAQACFWQAVHEVKKSDASADDVAYCLRNLADVLYREDTVEEVLPLYKEALHVLTDKYGKDSDKLIPTLVDIGEVHEHECIYRKALKAYTRAQEIMLLNKVQLSRAYGENEHRLGRVSFKLSLPRLAEEHYQSSLAILMNQPDLPSEQKLNELLADYIDMYRKSDNQSLIRKSAFQKELLKDRVAFSGSTSGVAESAFSKAVSIKFADVANAKAIAANSGASTGTQPSSGSAASTAPVPGVGGVPVGDDYSNRSIIPDRSIADKLALDQINQQRIDFYERMIAIDVKSLGSEHPSVARDLNGLATIYLTQREYGQAKPLLQRALMIYKKVYGDDAQVVTRTETLLNLIADEQNSGTPGTGPSGNYLSSLPVVPLQAQKIEIALRLNYLALLCYSFGRVEEAKKIYEYALADTVHVFGKQSVLTANCLLDYSLVLRNTGHQTEAEADEKDAQSIIRLNLEKQAVMALP